MFEDTVSDILLDQGVEFVVSLPCDRTRGLCSVLEKKFRYITIPREEDGIGICSGLALADRNCVLHMQSSGLGNSLNAIMTLPDLYGLSLLILASWRGYYQEKIIAQIPFNSKIPGLLSLYGIACTIISGPEDLGLIRDVISDARENHRVHVALISPRLWEGTEPEIISSELPRSREVTLSYTKKILQPVMQRADAIDVIAGRLKGELVISNIGVPSKELFAAKDRHENFYMLGSYTQATPIGLGLSLGTDKEVFVLDGDGSLMGTSVLPVVSSENPGNLTIICLDNGAFGSTGNQCSPSHHTVDLELLARAGGIRDTCTVHTPEELILSLSAGKKSGPRFIHVIIRPGNTDVPAIPLLPREIRDRFTTSV
jgi:sulfopyruvate decarboxylase subunit beta